MTSFTVHTDGAARGNPGPAGAGWVILDAQGNITERKKYLGELTNNQAEYQALLLALEDIQTKCRVSSVTKLDRRGKEPSVATKCRVSRIAKLDIEHLKKGSLALTLYSDSELLVRQLNGEYKVKNEGLRPLFQKAVWTLSRLKSYSIKHIPREQNEEADRLANEAIDEHFAF